MDFILTAPSGEAVQLPLNPERITVQTGARLQSIEIVELGELRLPRGRTPARISWSGILPGLPRQDLVPVRSWRLPHELLALLEGWRDSGERVHLLVTETPINLDVFIETLAHDWGGGFGDCEYKLEVVEAREAVVLTDVEWRARAASAAQSAPERPVPAAPAAYTVRPGDTLWSIAKQVLQDGSRWRELYEANRDVVGPDPNLIRPGQVLRIPGR